MQASSGLNITSIILGVAPKDAAEVSALLIAIGGVEVHAIAELGTTGRKLLVAARLNEKPITRGESDPDEEA